MSNDRAIRRALIRSHNYLKYQYETDKQIIMRMDDVVSKAAAMIGLNMLASVLKENEKALAAITKAESGA